jgi:hypothetical protein
LLSLRISPVTVRAAAGSIGQNAGVIVALSATAATSGTVTGSGTLAPAQIAGMINAQTYINVHTSAFPSGEAAIPADVTAMSGSVHGTDRQ